MVAQIKVAPNLYSLIDLTDGVSWDNPAENIEDVFDGMKSDFQLIR